MNFRNHSFRYLALILLALASLGVSLTFSSSSRAQQPKREEQPKRADQPKQATAEQIAESVIVFAGSGAGRAMLTQIRKNGLERGRETRTGSDGRAEEI